MTPAVPVTVTVKVPVVAEAEAVSVSVEDALPPAAGVTDDGANDAVTPAGSPEAESAVAAENPLRLVTVVVEVPLPPCAIETDDGDRPIEKSGAAAAFTVSENVVECVVAPEVPVTVTVTVPVEALPDAVSVRVDAADPFAGGVTEAGENEAVTPAGSPEAESVVAAEKPLTLVIVPVVVPLPPCVTDTDVGETVMPKSGEPAPVDMSRRQVKVPVSVAARSFARSDQVPFALCPLKFVRS